MRRSMGIQSVLPCLVLICSTARVTRSRQTTYSSTSSRDGCSRARKVMRSLNSGCRSRKRSKATNPRMMFLLRSRRSTRSSRNSRRRRSRLRSSAAMRRAVAALRSSSGSIDADELRRAATARRMAAEERSLLRRRREFLLLRVDRLDLSKNIIRGFVAFDRFLDLHPEFKDRITFLALLQPSREDVEEYVVYRERVTRAVEQINTKHGNTDWMPIDLRIEDNFPQTLAAYRHYDALMVNAIFDGMNLVAKEGPRVLAEDEHA